MSVDPRDVGTMDNALAPANKALWRRIKAARDRRALTITVSVDELEAIATMTDALIAVANAFHRLTKGSWP